MDIVQSLFSLNAAAVLKRAAEQGFVAVLECAMPRCDCPEGRGYFERRKSTKYGKWAPSPDRWPIPGRDGGKYAPDNTRLSHAHCNVAAGGRIGGSLSRPAAIATLRSRGFFGSDEHRAISRRAGAASAISRRTAGTLDWQFGARMSAAASENGTKGGRIGGVVIACRRWNVERGKPCTCGKHEASP